jgi:enamine deaminase RidA (YjgF/YER057c/UK114 family)
MTSTYQDNSLYLLKKKSTPFTKNCTTICKESISRISTDDDRFSRAVVHGNTVYLSGLVPPAEVREFGITQQVDATLERVDELLAEAGTNKSKLLSANIWLKTMDDYNEMNERWIEWLDPDNKPVRACVEAGFSSQEILFEVMVVAAK